MSLANEKPAGCETNRPDTAQTVRAQVFALSMMEQNVQHYLNIVNAAGNEADDVLRILNRMKELAARSADPSCEKTERELIAREFESLKVRLSKTTADADPVSV